MLYCVSLFNIKASRQILNVSTNKMCSACLFSKHSVHVALGMLVFIYTRSLINRYRGKCRTSVFCLVVMACTVDEDRTVLRYVTTIG